MRLQIALISAFAMVALPAAASAAACKDAKGKFIKCPPAAGAVVKPATAKTTTKKVAVKSTSKRTGKCRDAKGRFAKCGAPGTHPA